MNYNSLYKLAFAQDPTVAVASAAAAVGLPRCFTKLSVSSLVAKRLFGSTLKRLAGSRSGLSRQAVGRLERGTLQRMATKRPYMRGVKGYKQPNRLSPQKAPGIGQRIAKDWWTIPVGAAGAYGVAHGVGAMADGLGGDAGGDMQMGYGYPAAAQTPAQGRYEQMMSLARRYGYS